MSISAAFVLFATIWFLCLFISLQVGQKTQGDVGEIEPGTPASAPADFNFRRKLIWVTGITILLWVAICAVILSGWISIADIDFRGTGS